MYPTSFPYILQPVYLLSSRRSLVHSVQYVRVTFLKYSFVSQIKWSLYNDCQYARNLPKIVVVGVKL